MNLRKAIERLEAGAQELDVDDVRDGSQYADVFLNMLSTNTTLETLRMKCDKIICVRALAISLCNNATLTRLDLDSRGIDNAGVRALVFALFDNERSSLTTLRLGWSKLGAEGVRTLAAAMETNGTVTDLDLCHNDIGAAGAEVFAAVMKKNATLRSLDLGDNNIGINGAQMLAMGLTNLTYLDLRNNELHDRGVWWIAKALVQNKNMTLKKLNLSSNKIGDPCGRALAMMINHTALTDLDLSWNQIGAAGVNSFAETLNLSKTLTNLVLSLNRIGDEGGRGLAMILRNMALTELNLSSNRIGAVGLNSLAESLANNSTLTSLDISSNDSGDDGARALAAALYRNVTLTELRLSANNIGDNGTIALAEALHINQTLTNLSLRRNDSGDDGARALAAALHRNRTLTSLDLENTGIDDEGARALAAALDNNNNTTLKTLDLSYNGIGDVGAQSLATCLQSNSTLTELRLDNNAIDRGGMEALSAAFDHNRTLQDCKVYDNHSYYNNNIMDDRIRLNKLALKVPAWVESVMERGAALLGPRSVYIPSLVARTTVFAFGDELLDIVFDEEHAYYNNWHSPEGRRFAAAYLLPIAEHALCARLILYFQ
jgi:Ran GTPase-activating protein (RanGAP) involved in mRNA processing and transport